MATAETGVHKVMCDQSKYLSDSDCAKRAHALLIKYLKETNYLEETDRLVKNYEKSFKSLSKEKNFFEKLGNELKYIVLRYQVPSDTTEDVYYTVKAVKMADFHNEIQSIYYEGGVVYPTQVQEYVAASFKHLLDPAAEYHVVIKDYIDQMQNWRMTDKIRELYVHNKIINMVIVVNPILYTKLELQMLENRDLNDIVGARHNFFPGNISFYKEGEDISNRQWLSSVENFVLSSYIKPQDVDDIVIHQSSVTNFQSIPGVDKINRDLRKRKNNTSENVPDDKIPKQNVEKPISESKKKLMKKE